MVSIARDTDSSSLSSLFANDQLSGLRDRFTMQDLQSKKVMNLPGSRVGSETAVVGN